MDQNSARQPDASLGSAASIVPNHRPVVTFFYITLLLHLWKEVTGMMHLFLNSSRN